jgi:hypothetical protein
MRFSVLVTNSDDYVKNVFLLRLGSVREQGSKADLDFQFQWPILASASLSNLKLAKCLDTKMLFFHTIGIYLANYVYVPLTIPLIIIKFKHC